VKIRATILLVCFYGTLVSFSQHFPEKGMPLLQTYTPDQYHNKGKIWDIGSAPNGVVYMAADKGLLEFDGKTWNSFKGSNGFTRSLIIINDSMIYTGSDLDFGVWKRNKIKAFEYTSLYPFRQEAQDISEEFWDVHYLNNNIFFVSSQNIYVYINQQLTRIAAPNRFTGSFAVNDSLYLADEKNGLYLFDKTALMHIFSYPDNLTFEISGIYHRNNGAVIVTKNAGLYFYSSGRLSPLQNAFSETLKAANVFSFEPIDETHLAFGTVLKGLFIADVDGNIIHRINRYKGLLSNTILSLHYSNAGKLWAGTDYGVSSLYLKNNITFFYDYRGDYGTAYTAQVMNGVFYLGTNQGLYRSAWDDLSNDKEFTHFQLVSGSGGQVWTLESIDNTLFIGHDHGLFKLRNDKIEKLDQHEGVWTIVPYKEYLFTGNYNGISIFGKLKSEWTFLKKMDLIFGSCNQLIIEKENILWVNIPNFGIIRAMIDQNLHPAKRLIFPDSLFAGHDPWLTKNDKGIQVFTDQYQYTYNGGSNEFIQESVITSLPKAGNMLAGVYQSVALHPDYDFFPVYNGFALKYLHYIEERDSENFSLIFRKTEAFSNDKRVAVHPGASVPFKLNNFRIEYIVPNQDDVLYQYKLNETGRWSDWSPDNISELINISNGEFSFFVTAMINGRIAGTNAITLRIAPPWHRSWYAYALYFMMLLLTVYLIRRWQILALKKQKKGLLLKEQNSLRQQAEKHKEKIMMLEQERLKAEYDQVKQQLRSKTVELANKAKDNEDKNRLLLSLKEKFDLIRDDDPCISKLRLGEIRRLLDSYLKIDDKTFEIQMDELHQEFFRNLKEKFPTLSNNDLRLCAYLRVGLNSKEIADILNIQPSSSYISRSRLRKKLNLKPEEDLYDFLNKI
jgi:AraC family transcriptional regulator, chitin signaling transcriptional activator